MKAYQQLTLAQLRIFWRNRQVLFWTLAFPVVLMLALGFFLGNGNTVSISIGVTDTDETATSRAFSEQLQQTEGIQVRTYADLSTAKEALQQGDIQLVLEIPKGLEEQITVKKDTAAPLPIQVYYNETNMATSQLGLTVVNQVIDSFSKSAVGYQPIVSIQSEGVKAVELRYIDFLVPGIVAMMIMSNNMNGVAGQIASWRERGILRRMQGTRLKPKTFIAAQITARLLLNGSQALLVLLIANLVFDLEVRGSWPVLVGFVVLGTLTFMAIGFIIAGVAKTPESAGPIAAFASFPMLFLGGVFFPIQNMPSLLQPIVKLLPISHLSTALRETMNIGTPLLQLWPETLILGGWLIAAFTAASFAFKWE